MKPAFYAPTPERLDYIDRLKLCILSASGKLAVHVCTQPVCENFPGHGVWEGDVEIFLFADETTGGKCFAWGETIGDQWRAVVISRSERVTDAADAVRHLLSHSDGQSKATPD